MQAGTKSSTSRKGREPQNCRSCGRALDASSTLRKYCSVDCRKRLEFVLHFSEPLLWKLWCVKATMRFESSTVVLDILIPGASGVCRYLGARSPGQPPAEALMQLLDRLNRVWDEQRSAHRFSPHSFGLARDAASTREDAFQETVAPARFSVDCERRLRRMGFDPREGLPTAADVKAAYRRLAKVCHPDLGGKHEKMITLTKAFQDLTTFLRSTSASMPQHRHTRRAFWTYSAKRGRWSPPD